MSEHGKKIIAPVIIVLAFFVLDVRIVTILLRTTLPATVIVMGLLFPFVLTAILFGVLVERIREVMKGDEDDLGNY